MKCLHLFVAALKSSYITSLKVPFTANGISWTFLYCNTHPKHKIHTILNQTLYLQWISSPMVSAKNIVPAQIAVMWVGGLWELLKWEAPTPHWPEQQTECTHSSAKDKYKCDNAWWHWGPCTPSLKRHWIATRPASSDDPLSGQQAARASRMQTFLMWCGYIKIHTVNDRRVQLWLSRLPTPLLGNIFS